MCDSKKIDLTSRDYADFVRLLDSEPNADLKRVVRTYIDSCLHYKVVKIGILAEDILKAVCAWRDQTVHCSGELPEVAKNACALADDLLVQLAGLLAEDLERSWSIKDYK